MSSFMENVGHRFDSCVAVPAFINVGRKVFTEPSHLIEAAHPARSDRVPHSGDHLFPRLEVVPDEVDLPVR